MSQSGDPTLRVLVCTADIGCGHGRAAAAVTLALRHNWPEIDTHVLDVLTTTPGWFLHVYRDLYFLGTKHLPRLTGWFYDWTDFDGTCRDRGIFNRIESRALASVRQSDLVANADLIICTHFLCARVLSAMRSRGLLKAKLAVIVTDQHPHNVWRVPHADLFLVASETAAAELVRHGISEQRIAVTGIPIDARFDQPISRSTARRKHHIASDARVLLLSGGGLGLGGIDEALDGVLQSGHEVYAIAVCGKNQSLHDRLLKSFGRDERCRIIGHTARMHELMAAADLMVGKPGGLTTSEAAVMGLPMVLLPPLPGQEEHNASALVGAGMAVLHADPYAAGNAAAELAVDSQKLEQMCIYAQQFARRDSARTAAQAALDLCATEAVGAINQSRR